MKVMRKKNVFGAFTVETFLAPMTVINSGFICEIRYSPSLIQPAPEQKLSSLPLCLRQQLIIVDIFRR